jgi:hypothetical protein
MNIDRTRIEICPRRTWLDKVELLSGPVLGG